jgi:hypothetical protein
MDWYVVGMAICAMVIGISLTLIVAAPRSRR